MSERSFREPRRRGFEDEVFAPRRPHGFAAPAPRFRAPAPRPQLPSGPPLRATVKWFSPEKGFGFVVLADGSGDAFLHAGVVERSGHDLADLAPGATLQIRVGPGQKGPQVGEILEVDKNTAAGPPAPNPGKSPPQGPNVGGHGIRMTGTVKWYSPEKRFGFVAVEGGQREVFVHATALQRSGIANLSEGQRVAMEVGEGRKGLEALSVSLTG
jgi:cold shock protein